MGIVHVLDADPDLLEAVPEDQRDIAVRDCVAAEISVPVGEWDGAQDVIGPNGLGFLMISGLLIRRVGLESRFGAELLGPGDLLRPWQREDQTTTLPLEIEWQVLEPMDMAVLDEEFELKLTRFPLINGRLVGRVMRRSRYLTVNMAIAHQPRIDTRLLMLLWQLAARWGKVTTRGVKVPIKLTHEVLAELTAARRPTVSTAMTSLSDKGLVETQDDGWLLVGDPPNELLELGPRER